MGLWQAMQLSPVDCCGQHWAKADGGAVTWVAVWSPGRAVIYECKWKSEGKWRSRRCERAPSWLRWQPVGVEAFELARAG